MESDVLWLSIGIGVLLGATYVAAGFLSNRRALRSERNTMLIVIGTMVIRIFAALVVLVVILLLLPVRPTALVGSFFVMFVVGLAVEVWILLRIGTRET